MRQLFCTLILLLLPVFACGAVSSAVVDHQEMEQILVDYFQTCSEQLPRVELRLKSFVLPQSFKVPQGRIVHEIVPAKPGVIGSRRVTLITRVDGRTVGNHSVRVELEALAEIAVSTASLRRGQLLTRDDIELRYQDVSNVKRPIFAVADVVGKRLKRSVRLGDPLQEHQIEFPPLIKRGQRVVIEAKRGGLMLTAAGEARQDGRPGEAIRVMNSGSRKEVLCQVVAPGLVRVEF